jgi:competence protein ComEC
MREIVTATIATQLAVLPLLLYQIGQLSIVALPVNLLVLPLVPATMLVGFLAGLVALVAPFMATPLALVAGLMLRYMFWVVELFSRVPFAAVNVPPISTWMLACIYALMAWYAYRYHAKNASVPGYAVR